MNKFSEGNWRVETDAKWMSEQNICKLSNTLGIVTDGYASDDPIHDANLMASSKKMYAMLERLIGNYQEAASIAEHEGYETRYAQDAILVDLLLAEARGEK